MPPIAVSKWHGTGNDFVLLDDRARRMPIPYSKLAQRVCHRRFGIGADGLLVILPPPSSSADLAMRIFNSDGSEAEMCGNGVRCVALYAAERSAPSRPLRVETAAGLVIARLVEGGRVEVDMGVPHVLRAEENVEVAGIAVALTAVSMGNPHAAAWVDRDPETFDLAAIAAAVGAMPYFPAGVNVELAQMVDDAARMRVWERGVGETWACGTGACAVAVSAIRSRRAASPVDIATRGGAVSVRWEGEGRSAFLIGPAERVFETTIDV